MPTTHAGPPAYSEAGPSRHYNALTLETHPSPPDLPPATQALIALTQDVSALLSLSIEATASIVHDWLRASLCRIGLGTRAPPLRSRDQKYGKGEVGRGLAVVVVGAAERGYHLSGPCASCGSRIRKQGWWRIATILKETADRTDTGQSLSLQLARSGYTVFPFLPLPASAPLSSPTSSSLSSLLLAWSNIQRRLRQRYPHHPGSIVPIITDPEPNSPPWVKQQLKGKDRFRHAGETVRAYLRDSGLELVAVVCATQVDPGSTGQGRSEEEPGRGWSHHLEQYGSPETDTLSLSMFPSPTPPSPPSLPSVDRDMLESITPPQLEHIEVSVPGRGLLSADENALMGLYRANVLDPLTAVRELRDLLTTSDGPRKARKARLVFVNAPTIAGGTRLQADETVLRVITAARTEAIALLREDLADSQVEVCEVVAGTFHIFSFRGRAIRVWITCRRRVADS